MSEGTIRISKIMKDFNIGLGTLVEFLKKKGVDVEPNPGAKISAEAFALVEKEFSKEQLIKEQSRKVAITVKEITDKVEHSRENAEDAEPEKEIIIKTNVLAEKPKVKKPEPVAKPEEPETPEPVPSDRPDIKVIGKIDLDKPAAPKAPEKPEEKPEEKPQPPVVPVEAPKPVETPKPAVPEYIETKVEKLQGPKISGTIDLSKFEKKPSQNQNKDKDSQQHDQSDKNKARGNKGKRERIHKNGANKVDVNRPDNGNNQNGRRGQNAGRGRGKDTFKFVKAELDEEEIQKQIKETYARMTEGKGKTKGAKHRREKRDMFEQKMEEEHRMEMASSNILKVTEFVTVNDLAILMNNTPVTKVIEACMNLGLMVSINQRLDAEALVLVAEEFGYKIEFVDADTQGSISQEEDKPEELVERPPIITVMGHVDHGKTSLLDYIRKTNVIAGEAGGITQHIGAYNVKLPDGRRITFLDTPGHEAFTAMRARGAKITDIAIIIVAADDAVMPQTIEAINHAQAAGVPMVFAINKIDKPGANSEKIKEQLANMNILVEDWGGKYQCQEISAKKGINVDKLLDKVLLEADLLELKANPNKKAVGSVIESSLDKGRGYLATIMVQGGTLHVGDVMLSGCYTGKVKAMFNERGQKIDAAGPSTPVSVLGLNGAPTAGDNFNVLDDEKEAKDIANKREQLIRIQGIKTTQHITLEEIGRRIAIGNFKELNIVLKADVDGSIEALTDSLIKLSTEEVKVNVIHRAVGAISESDVLLAAASNAIIIGFQVRPSANARKMAEKEGIEIRLYSVIYDAINEVKDGIEGMLAPEEKEEITATAEVMETFKISKVGTIAGCMVRDGKLTRAAKIRVIRDGIVVYTGVLGSLKRFKDDVKEVAAGFDCGLNIDGYNDIKIGDVIESYTIVEVKRKL
ncbi:MAG: translation initiation factor IF-2 [Bacteroidales bacterium]|nr:translation initiation factor IF-2 [Bacteroidales bacterium]